MSCRCGARAAVFGGVLSSLLVAAATVRCSNFQDGIEVTVRYEPASLESEEMRSDLGYTVVLDRGRITFASAEILPCAAGTRVSARTPAPFFFSPLSTAAAHTASTPRRLGVPVVVDLLRGIGKPEVPLAGRLTPPPGRWCSVRVGLGPPDDDALGWEAGPRAHPLTVDMTARWSRGSGDGGMVSLRSDASREIELPLEPPLETSSDSMVHELAVTAHPERWFDGVDFAQLSRSRVNTHVLDNALGTLEAVHQTLSVEGS